MQGYKLPENIEQWDYETVRRYLLKQAAGFKFLIKYLIKKYHLENISEKALFSSLHNNSKLGKDMLMIYNDFSVEPAFVDNSFSQCLFSKDTGIEQELPMFISWGNQVLPEGFYIKINKYTSVDTVKRTYKEIQEHINYLGSITRFKFKAKQRNKKQKDIVANLTTYLLIEQDIYAQLNDLKSLNNKRITYIVEGSIMYVTEELYGQLSDKQEERKNKQTKDLYYSVMDYYSLPSLTLCRKLLIRYLL